MKNILLQSKYDVSFDEGRITFILQSNNSHSFLNLSLLCQGFNIIDNITF